MRIATRLLALPLLAPVQPATLRAQAYAANAHVAAADTPVTVRWNRLVPKLWLIEIGPRLSGALYRVAARHLAATEPLYLRKDVPHPVRQLLPRTYFGQYLRVDWCLRADKPIEVVRIVSQGGSNGGNQSARV